MNAAVPSAGKTGPLVLQDSQLRSLSLKDQRDIVILALILGTLLVFLPVVYFDFLNFDDPQYVAKRSWKR